MASDRLQSGQRAIPGPPLTILMVSTSPKAYHGTLQGFARTYRFSPLFAVDERSGDLLWDPWDVGAFPRGYARELLGCFVSEGSTNTEDDLCMPI
jgi:hypothetical protein